VLLRRILLRQRRESPRGRLSLQDLATYEKTRPELYVFCVYFNPLFVLLIEYAFPLRRSGFSFFLQILASASYRRDVYSSRWSISRGGPQLVSKTFLLDCDSSSWSNLMAGWHRGGALLLLRALFPARERDPPLRLERGGRPSLFFGDLILYFPSFSRPILP